MDDPNITDAHIPSVKEPLLLIDDDLDLAEMLAEYLEPEGYLLETAETGSIGLQRVREDVFSLVILDVCLPDHEGFHVLAEIRKMHPVPIIMLTTKASLSDRVTGLKAGADDYVPKPFAPEELLARIQTVLRRTQADIPRASLLSIEDLVLDPSSRTIHRAGEFIHSTAAEFDLLRLLLASPGCLVSREQLTQVALGRETYPGDRGVDNLVSSLRRKLGSATDGADRFRSVRNSGYVYARPRRQDVPGKTK